jgi:hypothetical protein
MPFGEKYDRCGIFEMKLDMAKIRKPNMQDSMSKPSERRNGCTSFGNCVHEMPRESFFILDWRNIGRHRLMKQECSKAICEATGKPEAYIGVSITDKVSVIVGGSEDVPCALGNMYSIGAIAMESNGKIQAGAVTDLLEPVGVAENRIYINHFFDMPRANVGWSRCTFAGL